MDCPGGEVAVLQAGFLQAASPPHPVCRARVQRRRAGLLGPLHCAGQWLQWLVPSVPLAGARGPARSPAPAMLRRAGGTHSRAGPGSSRRAAAAAKSQLSGPPPPRKVNNQGRRRRQTATERENSSASQSRFTQPLCAKWLCKVTSCRPPRRGAARPWTRGPARARREHASELRAEVDALSGAPVRARTHQARASRALAHGSPQRLPGYRRFQGSSQGLHGPDLNEVEDDEQDKVGEERLGREVLLHPRALALRRERLVAEHERLRPAAARAPLSAPPAEHDGP